MKHLEDKAEQNMQSLSSDPHEYVCLSHPTSSSPVTL